MNSIIHDQSGMFDEKELEKHGLIVEPALISDCRPPSLEANPSVVTDSGEWFCAHPDGNRSYWVQATPETSGRPFRSQFCSRVNGNWDSRCQRSGTTRHRGQGYIACDYSYNEVSRYDMRISLWLETATWWNRDHNNRAFEKMQHSTGYKVFETDWLWFDGPGRRGPNHRGGYFKNYTSTQHSFAACFLIQVRERHSHEDVGTWLFQPSFGQTSNESRVDFLKCGTDHNLWIWDA